MKDEESEIKNVKTKKAQPPAATPSNGGEAASTTTEVTNEKGNVVLKNEKIEKKSGENKNCC